MPRSLVNGDYRLVMAVESSSRVDSWYRVLVDRQTGQLSCDCPTWIFRQNGSRTCKHTQAAQGFLTTSRIGVPYERAKGAAATNNVLVQATQQQWPGLHGVWAIEQSLSSIDTTNYHFVSLQLKTGNSIVAGSVVAFNRNFHPTPDSRIGGVAGWAGYAIAAEIARQAGYPLAGQPPTHFKVSRRGTRRRGPDVIGLHDILRVGDQINLGDGLTPTQRAENTLQLFLGSELYTQLETNHFLDVSSVQYAHKQRVYRVRRDPNKSYDRRVRIFEHGEYVNDFCIVRAQSVPEADHWLTVFLGLISDETQTLSVVKDYNIFDPFSDGDEEEHIPAIWQPRAA